MLPSHGVYSASSPVSIASCNSKEAIIALAQPAADTQSLRQTHNPGGNRRVEVSRGIDVQPETEPCHHPRFALRSGTVRRKAVWAEGKLKSQGFNQCKRVCAGGMPVWRYCASGAVIRDECGDIVDRHER